MVYTPSNAILKTLDSKAFPWRIFVVDTETTGFKGSMQHHRLNQVLQVCCYDLKTGVVFDQLCKPEGIKYIPDLSVNCHRITLEDVKDMPPPHLVMDAMIDFINLYKGDKIPLLVAHNAPFDREMILKSIKNKAVGFGAQYLKWEWMDTVHEVKMQFPWLKEKYWPEQGPHKLETLMSEFYPNIPLGEAHNAKADVANLSRILCELLWEKIFVPSSDERARDHDLLFQRYPPRVDPRSLSVLDIRGFGAYRAGMVYEKVKDFFERVPEMRKFIPSSTHLFLVGHVYQYALVKWYHEGQKGDCVYTGICREVELLLRKPPLNIADDSVVLELCKMVSGVWGSNDFAYHMMSIDGRKEFFPVLRGSKDNWVECYLKDPDSRWYSSSKVAIDDFSALTLKQKFDIGSIHDLYMEYNFTPPSMRAQFCKQVQAYFPIDIIITPEIVEKMFKKCYLG